MKTILARKGCSVIEAVYRYNTMPRGNYAQSAPANQLFQYEVRLLGIDDVSRQDSPVYERHRFSEGDRVWVRHPNRRCDTPSTEGTVTRVVSAQNVEVDGMPRHVRDLRLSTSLPRDFSTVEEKLDTDAQEDLKIRVRIPTNDLWEEEDDGEDEEEAEMDSPGRQLPRRSSRERHPVLPFQYCDL